MIPISIIGYTGTNCDIEINECDSNPCQNNGTCHDLLNDYRCQCKYKVEKVPGGTNRTFETGFRGKNCEIDIDECAVRPTICLNVAQCTNNNGSFNCYCGSDTQGNYFTGNVLDIMSRRMGKPIICIGKNKGADQLCSNC